MSRIKEKTKEIENYLFELGSIKPSTFEEYKEDIKSKAACERYAEKIIEAVIDLAFIIIKQDNFKIPEEDNQAFDMLIDENIISKELGERLKNAKGMRNILAHEYGEVDDEVVFYAITKELTQDVQEFIKFVKRLKRG